MTIFQRYSLASLVLPFVLALMAVRVIAFVYVPLMFWDEAFEIETVPMILAGLLGDLFVFGLVVVIGGFGCFPRLIFSLEVLALLGMVVAINFVAFFDKPLTYLELLQIEDLIQVRDSVPEVVPTHIVVIEIATALLFLYGLRKLLTRQVRNEAQEIQEVEKHRPRLKRFAHLSISATTALLTIGSANYFFGQTAFGAGPRVVSPIYSIADSLVQEQIRLRQMRVDFAASVDVDSFRKSLYRVENFSHLDKNKPLLRKLIADPVIDNSVLSDVQPYNLVILVVESIFNTPLGKEKNGKIIGEKFLALADEGLLFNQFYSTWGISQGAYESIYYSVLPNSVPFKQGATSKQAPSLIQILEQNGYRSGTFSATQEEFQSIRSKFSDVIGHDFFYGPAELQQDSKSEIPISQFGVDDHLILNKMYDWLAAYRDSKPFVLSFISVSNHSPFATIKDPAVADTIIYDKPQSPLEAYYNTYNYTIEEVAKFINRAKDLPIFDNTVFIVVGDHRPDVIVKYEKYSELRKEFNLFQQHLVPLLIYAPKVIKSNAAIESRVSSQLDILPTVLDIVGIRQPTMAMGQSLIRQDFYSQRFVSFPAHEAFRFDSFGARRGKLYKLDEKANIVSEHNDVKLLRRGKKFRKDRESYRIYFRDVIF